MSLSKASVPIDVYEEYITIFCLELFQQLIIRVIYDFQINENTLCSDAISSFCEMIAAKNGAVQYGTSQEYSLYDTVNRRELARNMTLRENGVVSGMKLILA